MSIGAVRSERCQMSSAEQLLSKNFILWKLTWIHSPSPFLSRVFILTDTFASHRFLLLNQWTLASALRSQSKLPLLLEFQKIFCEVYSASDCLCTSREAFCVIFSSVNVFLSDSCRLNVWASSGCVDVASALNLFFVAQDWSHEYQRSRRLRFRHFKWTTWYDWTRQQWMKTLHHALIKHRLTKQCSFWTA